MSAFKDHFSESACAYAAHRPSYPTKLFAWLARQARHHDLAWDCATGSGQAALGLAGRFGQVVATDASTEQIAQARSHHGVSYRVAPAEASGLSPASVDLVTVAQAAHWFDLPAFYAEVRQVLRPGGVVALWCYGRLQIEPGLDEIIEAFYRRRLGPYWPPERRHVEAGYLDLDFPFVEVTVPAFAMKTAWDLDQLMGYFATWSAVSAYRRTLGQDPLPALRSELEAGWISLDVPKLIKWPLSLRLGRV